MTLDISKLQPGDTFRHANGNTGVVERNDGSATPIRCEQGMWFKPNGLRQAVETDPLHQWHIVEILTCAADKEESTSGLFNGAKVGDKFLTRDGEIVAIIKIYPPNSEYVVNAKGWGYFSNGRVYRDGEHGRDIIEKHDPLMPASKPEEKPEPKKEEAMSVDISKCQMGDVLKWRNGNEVVVIDNDGSSIPIHVYDPDEGETHWYAANGQYESGSKKEHPEDVVAIVKQHAKEGSFAASDLSPALQKAIVETAAKVVVENEALRKCYELLDRLDETVDWAEASDGDVSENDVDNVLNPVKALKS